MCSRTHLGRAKISAADRFQIKLLRRAVMRDRCRPVCSAIRTVGDIHTIANKEQDQGGNRFCFVLFRTPGRNFAVSLKSRTYKIQKTYWPCIVERLSKYERDEKTSGRVGAVNYHKRYRLRFKRGDGND